MKKKFFSFFLTLVLAASAGAQSGNSSTSVSQIKAESRNNLIRLTWVDSPDAQGPVYIFRSVRPFGNSVPPNIRPVTVRYGEQYYIDDSDDMETIYYFIAASDVSGRRYDAIIPRTNSTNVNRSGSPSEPEIAAAPVSESIMGISNLRARQDGERVIITFDISDPGRNAVLYRSRQPIRQSQDLINAVIVQSGISSPFTDFPISGISWYYALVFEDDVSGGSLGIRPGVNTTITAVTISGDESAQKDMRPTPLPALSLRSAITDGYFLLDVTEKTPLGKEAEQLLRSASMPSKAPLKLKTPRVFAVDLKAPASGEESALFEIVKEYFEKQDWESARVSLQRYLTLPRSKDVEARARFYLGQTLYYTGNYKGALFEFLSIKSTHTVEANIWIDAVLTAMVY